MNIVRFRVFVNTEDEIDLKVVARLSAFSETDVDQIREDWEWHWTADAQLNGACEIVYFSVDVTARLKQ